MAELRYNPFLGDWVMVASHRQNRPQMPADWCPFCPGSGKVPDDYTVYKYDNDFPALSPNPPEPDAVATEFFATAESYGKCEVILYSPDHTAKLQDLSDSHVKKLVDLWAERYQALEKDPRHKYIFIFENRGEIVGVTMPHPHGQIYAYPYVPKKIATEIDRAEHHYSDHGRCLFCDALGAELEAGARIITQNDSFVVYLPFHSEYPYGINIISKRHLDRIDALTEGERADLADILKTAVGTLDSLFDYAFPYMMCLHQAPPGGGCAESYHFHIEFYTPMRSRDKVKFNASSETGAWAPCNPRAPEESAEELRTACEKYLRHRGT
ncbi:galactose-1-phosphate uridylyltransferase [Oscillospiraceae bacterium OttesenSCG-928-F05]|nr:galactose-1-phosphate uridylyltransferase [Oscillospiraceae bacterium OttesenSCG-928-F05]